MREYIMSEQEAADKSDLDIVESEVDRIVCFLDNHLRNDHGILVRWSMLLIDDEDYEDADASYVYCGRRLGRDAIQESDGRCGPSTGAPCRSCLRLVHGPDRLSILRRMFPTLPPKVITTALRESSGSLFNAGRYLERLNAPRLPYAYGLAPPSGILQKKRHEIESRSEGEESENNDENEGGQCNGDNDCDNYVHDQEVNLDDDDDDDDDDDGHDHDMDPLELGLIEALALGNLDGHQMAREALIRHDGDIEGAVAWLLDDVDAVARAVAEKQKRRKEKQKVQTIKEWKSERRRVVQVLTEQSLPQEVLSLAEEEEEVPREEDVFVEYGHRMVKVFANRSQEEKTMEDRAIVQSCVICAATSNTKIEKTPMTHQCELCHLCDACVRHRVVFQCPRPPNGGVLHHHPLLFDLSRTHHCCNLPFEGCLNDVITWCCHRCDFDVCPKCAAREPPKNYDRVICQIVEDEKMMEGGSIDNDNTVIEIDAEDSEEEQGEEQVHDSDDDSDRESGGDNEDDSENDSDDENKNDGEDGIEVVFDGQAFDERAAERVAAARWERTHIETNTGDVVVGTGSVGTTSLPSTTRRQRDELPINGSDYNHPSQTNLSNEAKLALQMYQSKHKEGGSHNFNNSNVAAAADITHVENILHRANAVGGDALMSRALNQAVAAGKLEIAGTLLLSEIFAPERGDGELVSRSTAARGVLHATKTKEQLLMCWCGCPIDSESSPDGAVGCLSGHAMHPSCAADLLLGGGLCPTCRQPLFFPQVPRPEAESALILAKAEMSYSRENELEKMRLEREELAAQGLKVTLNVGDAVRISSDIEACKKVQEEDPRSGGWGNDMAKACGTEGRITKIIFSDDEKRIAVQVKRQLGHQYVKRKLDDYYCRHCNNWDETVRRTCSRCERCVQCCRRSPDGSCPNGNQEYFWSPSLLELVWRADSIGLWDELSAADKEQSALKAAEEHIVRLKAELRAVSAARSAVKSEMESRATTKSGTWDGTMSIRSMAAIGGIVNSVSPADWRRARHLLLLGRQWGNTEKAEAKRVKLYEAIHAGDIDSGARIVRRYNAKRIAEAARWADAVAETGEYMVEPTAKVDLRAFPSYSAPRTGYSLDPKFRFFSKREVLDSSGNNMWLQVDEGRCDTYNMGDKVASNNTLHHTRSRALIGTKVRLGTDREGGDQHSGENDQGEIIQVLNSGEVVVRWGREDGEEYTYRAGKGGYHDLVYAITAPPPPQGWLCVRPGGLGSPAIVRRSRGALRCFCCGDGLMPTKFGKEKFSTVTARNLKKGDQVFVAATLEPVQIMSVTNDGHIYCTFPPKKNGRKSIIDDKKKGVQIEDHGIFFKEDSNQKDFGEISGMADFSDTMYSIWYRAEDLVVQKRKNQGTNNNEESNDLVCFKGQLRTRRELVLMCQGNEIAARSAWEEAKEGGGVNNVDADETVGFASCARGHLLHARCFQGALLAGRCCPAPGCTEPLWVPRVRRENNDDDDCCGGNNTGEIEEAEALKIANELVGHTALVSARTAEGVSTATRDELTIAGLQELRMCPVCCAGPLLNENCSNMQTHHGECSVSALRSGDAGCTPAGRFYVPASEIAKKILNLSLSKSIVDVLPRCPKHNVIVMFNGCMSCGHIFTDTGWDDLPAWDPKAKGMLELDKKKRAAADLLAKQIRTEAALLQFERDALWNTWGELDSEPFMNNNDSPTTYPTVRRSVAFLKSLPPLPPPAEEFAVATCGPGCRLDHNDDGDCLLCGQAWHNHYGHTCPGGARGCWCLNAVDSPVNHEAGRM